MEIFLWFAYGFVIMSIGMILGNRMAHRQMDKYIRDTMDRHQDELIAMIEEARDAAVKEMKARLKND